MRAVIQRVTRAQCQVEGQITGSIENGLVVLLGIESDDKQTDLEWLVQKISNLRIFSDENGQMNRSVKEINGEVLLVSQFTLFALTKKGNRPSFMNAAPAALAEPFYEMAAARFAEIIGRPTQMGRFGADMKLDLLNDGPVTIIMNTKDKDHF